MRPQIKESGVGRKWAPPRQVARGPVSATARPLHCKAPRKMAAGLREFSRRWTPRRSRQQLRVSETISTLNERIYQGSRCCYSGYRSGWCSLLYSHSVLTDCGWLRHRPVATRRVGGGQSAATPPYQHRNLVKRESNILNIHSVKTSRFCWCPSARVWCLSSYSAISAAAVVNNFFTTSQCYLDNALGYNIPLKYKNYSKLKIFGHYVCCHWWSCCCSFVCCCCCYCSC